MARLEERLAEATAALATLDELAGRNDLSLVERDGAILRLVYTFEAALLLEERERIAIGSPGAAIRASRQVAWLSDEDAEAVLKIAQERNLTVHMYRQAIGEAVASHLPNHAAVLRRLLEALQRRATAE